MVNRIFLVFIPLIIWSFSYHTFAGTKDLSSDDLMGIPRVDDIFDNIPKSEGLILHQKFYITHILKSEQYNLATLYQLIQKSLPPKNQEDQNSHPSQYRIDFIKIVKDVIHFTEDIVRKFDHRIFYKGTFTFNKIAEDEITNDLWAEILVVSEYKLEASNPMHIASTYSKFRKESTYSTLDLKFLYNNILKWSESILLDFLSQEYEQIHEPFLDQILKLLAGKKSIFSFFAADPVFYCHLPEKILNSLNNHNAVSFKIAAALNCKIAIETEYEDFIKPVILKREMAQIKGRQNRVKTLGDLNFKRKILDYSKAMGSKQLYLIQLSDVYNKIFEVISEHLEETAAYLAKIKSDSEESKELLSKVQKSDILDDILFYIRNSGTEFEGLGNFENLIVNEQNPAYASHEQMMTIVQEYQRARQDHEDFSNQNGTLIEISIADQSLFKQLVRNYLKSITPSLSQIREFRTYFDKNAQETIDTCLNSITSRQRIAMIFKELDQYVGLDEVKQEFHHIKETSDYLRFQVGKGTRDRYKPENYRFVGPAGTGKSSIAKLFAMFLSELNLVSTPTVAVITESDWVSQYVGETKLKVKQKLDQLEGSLIVIEDAATMISNQHGREALDAIALWIKNHQYSKTIFILTGDTDEMSHMLSEKGSIRDLVRKEIKFKNFTRNQLMTILVNKASEKGYRLSPSFLKAAEFELRKNEFINPGSGSNGRTIDTILNSALEKRAYRYHREKEEKEEKEAKKPESSEISDKMKEEESEQEEYLNEDPWTFIGSDFPAWFGQINEAALQDALDELDQLTGLKKVKKQIHQKVNLAREQLEHLADPNNRNRVPPLSLNMVFVGNPGTGKTTVARIYAKILKALGILRGGDLKEYKPSAFIGSKGNDHQSAKADAIMDASRDNVLFLDEAYGLLDHGTLGSQAITSIVKSLSNYPGSIAFIMAGYGQNMEQLWSSNDGLRSRMGKIITFEDYSSDTLWEMFKKNVEESFYSLPIDQDLEEQCQKIFKQTLEEEKSRHPSGFGNARFVNELYWTRLIELAVNRVDFNGTLLPLDFLSIQKDFKKSTNFNSLSYFM